MSQTQKYLGMPVSQARIVFTVVAVIILILFGLALFWYFRRRQYELAAVEKAAWKAQKKYKGIIVEIKDLPAVKPGETVILLSSLDDLIRTAEGLLKPVLHKAQGLSQVFCVFDVSTRYEYRLSLDVHMH